MFDDYNDMAARIDRDDLDVDADSVLVLRNAGPLGGPGMPEWGMLPVPKKLLKQGVRDMVRISDARMSGTSYGCCVLHVAPESFVGGPLALGEERRPDRARRGEARAQPEDGRTPRCSRRKGAWKPPPRKYERGYGAIFSAARQAGGRGLRLRFPRRHRAHARAGDPLTWNCRKTASSARSRRAQPQIGLWSSLSSNYSVEVIAGAGFDWILLDIEHSPSDLENLLAQLQAAAPYPTHPWCACPGTTW